MAEKTLKFEASARLQQLIGRGLIPNEEMAIVELVKNSYDSGARNVRILIQPDTAREPGFIRVSDDGSGMSASDIERLFMFAGYSERPSQVQTATRVPTGEKGIGRFATDKLGRTLDVYTTTVPRKGIHLYIDWRKFEVRGSKKFSDITASYDTKDVSRQVPGRSGTTLEIRHLTSAWQSTQVEKLAAWLGDLLDPLSRPKDFSIELEVKGNNRGIVAVSPISPTGDISLEMSVHGDRVRRIIRDRKNKKPIADELVGSTADLKLLRGVSARLIHFDRRPNKSETRGLEPGVRVYRDGFRIEPFGSRRSDWLGVAELRAKRAGHAHVVPSRLFGFVEISRKKNPDLGDTTSRQALLDTDAARYLVTLLRENLTALGEVLRGRKEPRWRENRQRKQAELEQARLHTLGEVASGLAHELRQPLQAIRTEADNIREKLKVLGVTDEDITLSQQAIDRGVVRINKNIDLVSDLSKGSFSEVTDCDLASLIKKEIGVLSGRYMPLGIEVSYRGPDSLVAKINELAFSIIVINLLQNAMESIATSGGSSIIVSLRKTRDSSRIEIEDNGAGVPDDVIPHLFSKFATKKTGGMGVGLHFCRMLVELHRGQIDYEAKRRGALFWFELPES